MPLYSDWKVSFTTIDVSEVATKDGIFKDSSSASSVSTASLSSEESISQSHSDAESTDVDTVDQVESSNNGEEDSEDEHEHLQPGETLFSVHRNMIGPKSSYFTQTFLSGKANSSIIALPSDLPSHTVASVVEAFELILDYCYNGYEKIGTEGKLTTENAVAMFCLCKYFEMDFEICEKVLDFINSDLSHASIAHYYQIVKDMRSTSDAEQPLVLDTKPIMDMIVIMCHQGPSVLDTKTDLFKISDLSLWLKVASALANGGNDSDNEDDELTFTHASKVWSKNITGFFDTHDIDKDSFRILTSESVLPEISSNVALQLLEHESNTDEGILDSSEPTALQQRCVKALGESNWTGKENDVDNMRGKLVNITSPATLEALLIDSVSGERAIVNKMEELKVDLMKEKKALEQERELFEYHQEQSRLEVEREKQIQSQLQQELEEMRKQCENFQLKLKATETKAEKDKEELRKANALLEAELEEEKKKTYALRQRFREVESEQHKLKSDIENYKLTIQETIKRIEAITTYDEPFGGCGLGQFVLLISSMSDRKECVQIKSMLQKVIKDPQTYERDILLKMKTNDDATCNESLLSLTSAEFTR